MGSGIKLFWGGGIGALLVFLNVISMVSFASATLDFSSWTSHIVFKQSDITSRVRVADSTKMSGSGIVNSAIDIKFSGSTNEKKVAMKRIEGLCIN